MAEKLEAQGRTPKSEPEARAKDFSQVVSRALVEIEPSEERRTFLLAKITEAQSDSKLSKLTEAGALVEALDKVEFPRGDPLVFSSMIRSTARAEYPSQGSKRTMSPYSI